MLGRAVDSGVALLRVDFGTRVSGLVPLAGCDRQEVLARTIGTRNPQGMDGQPAFAGLKRRSSLGGGQARVPSKTRHLTQKS